MNDIKPISIKQWNTGIAESPYLGFAEMRNVDVITHPGVLTLSPRLSGCSFTTPVGTFTVNTSTDVLTGPSMNVTVFGSGYTGIQACTVSSSGTLPAPLAAATIYYIIGSPSGNNYKICTSLANAQASTTIDITTTGSGTHTLTPINPKNITAFATDGAGGNTYGVDSDGRVWQLNGSFLWYLVSGNTITSTSGNGLAVYKNYLLNFRNNAIDTYGPLTGTPTWSNSWQTLKGGVGTHRTLVGQDDILYWGDDDGANNPFIGSLQQNSGSTFDPATGGTFTYTTGALALPQYKIVTALAELGVNLMVGTSGKEIYPWDRTSASFALPIVCPETYVYAMQNVGNQLYIAAGNKANIYLYNGYLAAPKKVFPKHLLSNDGYTATVGAMCVVDRKLLFTVLTVGNSGVYSLDFITGAMTMENVASNGSVGGFNPVRLNAMLSKNNYYFTSWWDLDASTYSIDVSSDGGTYRYPTSSTDSTFKSYVTTPNLDIGYYNEPRTLQYVQVYLDKPLATGHGVRVSYRLQVSGSFTTLALFTGDNVTQVFQANAANITGTDVQFRIDMYGSDSTTPYLQEVRII